MPNILNFFHFVARPFGLIFVLFYHNIIYFVYAKRGVSLKFQRIEDMRIDNDLTIKEVSSFLELHRDVYARYEKGLRQFPADIIVKLAEYYDCTTD